MYLCVWTFKCVFFMFIFLTVTVTSMLAHEPGFHLPNRIRGFALIWKLIDQDSRYVL